MPKKGQRGAYGAVRKRVLREVLKRPGAGIGEVARRLGFDQSTINYHAHILAREGRVQMVRDGRTLRLFKPTKRSKRELAPQLVARHRTHKRIVEQILKNPGMQAEELAGRLRLAKSTLSYHLKRLRARGIVTRKPTRQGYRLFVRQHVKRQLRSR